MAEIRETPDFLNKPDQNLVVDGFMLVVNPLQEIEAYAEIGRKLDSQRIVVVKVLFIPHLLHHVLNLSFITLFLQMSDGFSPQVVSSLRILGTFNNNLDQQVVEAQDPVGMGKLPVIFPVFELMAALVHDSVDLVKHILGLEAFIHPVLPLDKVLVTLVAQELRSIGVVLVEGTLNEFFVLQLLGQDLELCPKEVLFVFLK
jgi:hypothetical protein